MSSPPRKAVFLYNKPHILHLATVLGAGGDDVDPRRVDTAVTENVGKFCYVLLNSVKHTSKQVPKIVRKDLIRIDVCLLTEILHLPPNVCAAHRLTGFRDENLSR